jgi:YD repeat-containing protein
LFRNQTIFTDERDNRTISGYNSQGNLIEQVHSDRATESYVWQDSLMRSKTDPFGKTEYFQFFNDGLGNLQSFTDRSGKVTSFTYDPTFSVATSITRPGGRVTQFVPDSNGTPRWRILPMGCFKREPARAVMRHR